MCQKNKKKLNIRLSWTKPVSFDYFVTTKKLEIQFSQIQGSAKSHIFTLKSSEDNSFLILEAAV